MRRCYPLALALWVLSIPATEIKNILAPLVDLLECTNAPPQIQRACTIATLKIREELQQSPLTITRDAILFRGTDNSDQNLDLGHTCTLTAKITNTEVVARINGSATLDLSGNPLDGYTALVVSLPVQVRMTSSITERLGLKTLLGCSNYAKDHIQVVGELRTQAHLAVFFTLAPTFHESGDGDLVITIKPLVEVEFELRDTAFRDIDVRGESEIFGIVATFAALFSTLASAYEDYETGQDISIGQVLKELGTDLAVGVATVLPEGLWEWLVVKLAKKRVDKEVEKQNAAIDSALQGEIEDAVRRVLRLDERGERHFLVDKEVLSGHGELLPLPDGFCVEDGACDDGMWCTGAGTCVENRCVRGPPPCNERQRCNASRKACEARVEDLYPPGQGPGTGSGGVRPAIP